MSIRLNLLLGNKAYRLKPPDYGLAQTFFEFSCKSGGSTFTSADRAFRQHKWVLVTKNHFTHLRYKLFAARLK